MAEYQALLLGLEEARQAGSEEAPGLGRFRIDGEATQRPLPGQKLPTSSPCGAHALNDLKKFETWAIAHVPREENHLADEAANQAIDQRPRRGKI